MKKLLILISLVLYVTSVFSQDFKSKLEKAENGNSTAQYQVGYIYHNGENGISRNYAKARYWFEKAASKGNAAAAYYMGTYFYEGLGVDKNMHEAIKWFKMARKKGMRQAQDMISKCMRDPLYMTEIEYDDFNPNSPPILEIIATSVKFKDPNDNNAIDAGENCFITFDLINKGKGNAKNCYITATPSNTSGIYTEKKILPTISPNETRNVSMQIISNASLPSGKINITLQVQEPHGLGSDPIILSINTKRFIEPKVQVVDYTVTSTNSNMLKKKQPFDIQVLLQNLEYGTAEDVHIDFIVPDGVYITSEGGSKKRISSLKGGTTIPLDYSLIVSDNFKGSSIPIEIKIHEKYGKYAQDKYIELQLNQTLAHNKIEVQEKKEESSNITIEMASLTAEVDKNIPKYDNATNTNTFAVIIGNEYYNRVSNVSYVTNDANVFYNYCKNTLALPETNIHYSANATLNDIKHEISWLTQVMEAYKGEANVIFYYAGHGIPDESNRSSYLLPVDGVGNDVSTGYSLEKLYTELSSKPAKSVVVLLDACFSGAMRDGGMIASARGVAIKAKQEAPKGNMVVISAAQGDETAYPYKEKGHGMFTYFLLKKLQDSKGNCSLGELADYVTNEVRKQSVVINGKMQTPSAIASGGASDWKSWRLR